MLNQVVLIGRLVRDPELRDSQGGKKFTTITVAVPRAFKGSNGDYETDFIDCRLWSGIAENTSKFCKKGDLIGVKGRVETWVLETEEEKKYITDIIAEKITFLSSKKQDEVTN